MNLLSRLGFTATATALVGVQLVFPSVSHATTGVYIVSGTGSGTACSTAAPCGLRTALADAPATSTLVLEPGNFRSPSNAFTDDLEDSNGQITIEGVPGKPRPVIYTDALVGFHLTHGSTLRDVTVISKATPPSHSVILLDPLTAIWATGNATVSHVAVLAKTKDEEACSVQGTLVDSLCVATGQGGNGVFLSTHEDATPVDSTIVRGVTAVALGHKGYGLVAGAFTSTAKQTVSVTNTIARGVAGSVLAETISNGARTTVTLDYCDFGVVKVGDTNGVAKVHQSHRVSAPPVFVDEHHLKFGEAATSPTIDAGAGDLPTDVDLAGKPRTLGSAPDIGAFERTELPTATGLAVTKKSKHTLHVSVSVNPEGLTTSVKVIAKHGSQKVTTTAKAAGHGNTATTLHFKVKGLAKHKTYHLHAVATSVAGQAESNHAKGKTKKH
jgi:hypothetical protein